MPALPAVQGLACQASLLKRQQTRFTPLLLSSTHKRFPERSANMPFKRYVEIGRVALVTFGEDYGKLVVISDVVDQNRVSCSAKPGDSLGVGRRHHHSW